MQTNIKKTPLVELKKIEEKFNLPFRLFAKVESYNPTGSIKDRAVYQMLLDDYESKRINKDTVIIEATSGNTGISLSYFASLFGNRVIIVMPTSMSLERRRMISKFGAELVLVEGGMKECNEKAIELHKNLQNSIILGQFEHNSNKKAHYLYTSREIINELPTVKYIVSGIGSGGTISGIGKYVKENNLDIKMIGVEPFESPLLTKGISNTHLIQGIGANFVPKILELDVIDDIVLVKGEEAMDAARQLNELEDLYVGYSSGAALLGILEYYKNHEVNGDVCIILPDKGDRYTWE